MNIVVSNSPLASLPPLVATVTAEDGNSILFTALAGVVVCLAIAAYFWRRRAFARWNRVAPDVPDVTAATTPPPDKANPPRQKAHQAKPAPLLPRPAEGRSVQEIRFLSSATEIFDASNSLLAPTALSAAKRVRYGDYSRVIENLPQMLPPGAPSSLFEAQGYLPLVYQTAAAMAFHWLDNADEMRLLVQASILTGTVLPNWCAHFLSGERFFTDREFEFTKREFLLPYLVAASHLHLSTTAVLQDGFAGPLTKLALMRNEPISLLDGSRGFWAHNLNSLKNGRGTLRLTVTSANSSGLGCQLTKLQEEPPPIAAAFEGPLLILETVQENGAWLLGMGDEPRCYFCSEEVDTDADATASWVVRIGPLSAGFFLHPQCFFYDMVQAAE